MKMHAGLILILFLAIFILTQIAYNGYITDDTYIILRYSKNLAFGEGFSFNPGEKSYGFTTPLWVILLSIFGKSSHLPLYSKLLSSLFGLLSITAFFFLSKKELGRSHVAIFALLLFTCDPWFIRWSSSGMETSLAVFLVILGYLMYKNHHPGYPILFGFSTLTRPETGLLFILLLLWDRNRLKSITCYLIIFIPWLVFSWIYFGSPIPNTFLAKHGFTPDYVLASFLSGTKILGVTYIIELFFLLIYTLKTKKKEGILSILWIVLLIFFYSSGGARIISRYLLVLTPFIVLYGFKGIEMLGQKKKSLVYITVVIIFAINTWLGFWVNLPSCRDFTQGMRDCFIPIGKWLNGNTEEDAVIAAMDIGAIGYYSDRYILDIGGLVTKEMIPILKDNSMEEILGYHLYEKVKKPDFLVARDTIPYPLADNKHIPVFTKFTKTLGVSSPLCGCFYTLYKTEDE